ncbi:alpha/beta hydrolase [Melaminivora suipulveris]|uniref:Alpha/beta hydrolase n=1 Tax=Melaminivora suipulveris TaxID=2109913 RepID=A0A2R3QBI1_9BURK|nr:alpha/beta fold hydrolase [Melaminivora suipulveris]AVO49148.1 alpha/beta hydrolase [Melaminivora suipulveris]
MNAQTERLTYQGAEGAIEIARDLPAEGQARRGVAVIAHPHPLYGGTLDNKVVQTLARAFVACGFVALRFNFRGVGGSSGVYDEGRGELQDMLAVVQQAAPDGPIALAGFSFGAFVASHALAQLWGEGRVERAILVGTACSRFTVAEVPQDAHEGTLVIHGEHDETVPLTSVMDWARPQQLPVTVVPGSGHFFHGQLPLLKNLAMRHLRP